MNSVNDYYTRLERLTEFPRKSVLQKEFDVLDAMSQLLLRSWLEGPCETLKSLPRYFGRLVLELKASLQKFMDRYRQIRRRDRYLMRRLQIREDWGRLQETDKLNIVDDCVM